MASPGQKWRRTVAGLQWGMNTRYLLLLLVLLVAPVPGMAAEEPVSIDFDGGTLHGTLVVPRVTGPLRW